MSWPGMGRWRASEANAKAQVERTVIHKVLTFLPAAAGKNVIQQEPVLLDLLLLISQLCYAIQSSHDSCVPRKRYLTKLVSHLAVHEVNVQTPLPSRK